MPYHAGDPQNNHPMVQGMHPTWRCGGCGYTIVSRAEGYCLFCERGLLKPESTRPAEPCTGPGGCRTPCRAAQTGRKGNRTRTPRNGRRPSEGEHLKHTEKLTRL